MKDAVRALAEKTRAAGGHVEVRPWWRRVLSWFGL